jgi:hypothetical protein
VHIVFLAICLFTLAVHCAVECSLLYSIPIFVCSNYVNRFHVLLEIGDEDTVMHTVVSVRKEVKETSQEVSGHQKRQNEH